MGSGSGYALKKRLSGEFYSLIDWTISKNLKKGYGNENLIEVEQILPGNFEIRFNSVASDTFADGEFSQGSSGYFVYVADGSHENFPADPVTVKFKIQE